MPAEDSYASELAQLRAGLALGVVTIESGGRRLTYQTADQIRKAIDYFETLSAPAKRRRPRYLAASFERG